ncbi:MAG: hypothetical protein ACHBN1_22350 [Heteroscytonema crispum UTEX LB 1556]
MGRCGRVTRPQATGSPEGSLVGVGALREGNTTAGDWFSRWVVGG